MRTWIALLAVAALAAGCAARKARQGMEELTYGQPFEADYEVVLGRAILTLERHFPKGFDPDLTDEDGGDLITVWHYKMTHSYRESKRKKARVRVEDMGEGLVRVGITVMQQLNDNIDTPEIKEDAKWVRSQHDREMESIIERAIARRYLKSEPSEQWKERHRRQRRDGLRPDLVDRYKDVDLEDPKKDDDRGLPPVRDDD